MTLIDAKKPKELGLSSEDSPDRNKALSADLTCVDELHVSLQVAVDHENLVAAWVRAGPLSHLLVMLFDVLLKKNMPRRKTVTCTGEPLLHWHQILSLVLTPHKTGLEQRSMTAQTITGSNYNAVITEFTSSVSAFRQDA